MSSHSFPGAENCNIIHLTHKTPESPLDCKEIQPVHPKWNQSWILIGRTDAKAETPNTLATWCEELTHWKRVGKIEGRRKGTTVDEMVGWHHQLNGHEFGWAPGVGDGQGGPACCGPWGHKESDTTERLNWTELNVFLTFPRIGMLPWLLFTLSLP